MKKYYKIFTLVLVMLCACFGLVACGETDAQGAKKFSASACRQAYVSAGYTVVDMNVAINQTRQYNTMDNKPNPAPKYLMIDGNGNLKNLYNDVYAGDTKKPTSDINIYTNNGFIAIKNSEIIAIVAVKNSPVAEFTNQIYKNFYSNVSKDAVKNIYKFSDKL